MEQNALLVERRGPVLWLTINRPEQRNALTLSVLDSLGAALAAHADDPELRCALLTAVGDRCFAAGGDLRELDAIRTPQQARAMSRRGRAALDRVRDFPLPVVAALNGHALGGGAELALACDMRVATMTTTIGFLQAQLGVTPAWGGGIDLFHAIGPGRALEMLVSARRMVAEEALALGLVQRVCGEEESLQACIDDHLATLTGRPRQVLTALKAMVRTERAALHARLGEQEEERFVETWTHEDHWAAVERAEAARRNRPR